MLPYRATLKDNARKLRENLTDGERAIWSRVRGRQLLGVQFYRQKPIGNYIVDFFAPVAKLVIEIDGSQHLEDDHQQRDEVRDAYLSNQGIKVLRFNSSEVLRETDAVVEVIYRTVVGRLGLENPP